MRIPIREKNFDSFESFNHRYFLEKLDTSQLFMICLEMTFKFYYKILNSFFFLNKLLHFTRHLYKTKKY